MLALKVTPTLDQRLKHRTAPARPFVMHQRWEQLLFLHWHIDPAEIQKTLPAGLHVDTHEGRAWIAIVPFFMCGVRPRYAPAMPRLSNFLEANVRTYVHDDHGRSGVWFYSLDCNLPLAVWAARTFFGLPYQHACMSDHCEDDGTTRYITQRQGDSHSSQFLYRLDSVPRLAQPGSLDFFLAERYLLFSNTARGLLVGQVNHVPYPLVEAHVLDWDARLLTLAGFPDPKRPPDHIVGSPGVEVRIYPLVR